VNICALCLRLHCLHCSALAFSDAGVLVGAEALTQPLLSAADSAESGQPLLLEKDEPVIKDEASK